MNEEDVAEAQAGISNERSEQAAAEETMDAAEDASGSSRTETPSEEREAPAHANTRPFACPHCSGTIRYKKTLEEHEREHPEEPQLLTCDTCQRQFKARIARVRHTGAHSHEAVKEMTFPCKTRGKDFKFRNNHTAHLCVRIGKKHMTHYPPRKQEHQDESFQQKFTDRSAFLCHTREHINEIEQKTSFPCETCGREFKHQYNLKEHQRIHTGQKPHVCEYCGKGFRLRDSLIVHRRLHTGEQPFSCALCNKRFGYKKALVRHQGHHLKPYQCEECGQTFVERCAYTVHVRTHMCHHPPKCRVCSKTFASKQSLRNHMFTHNRERAQMLLCEVCGDSFKAVYMNIHMRTHTGEKPYKCRFCEATFAHISGRHKHEEIHSDRKAIQCKECSKSFLSAQGLKIHMRCHTGEKLYKCRFCNKTFAQPKTHKRHEATHSKEYPYNCAECGKGYVAKWELVNHIQSHRNRKSNVKWKLKM